MKRSSATLCLVLLLAALPLAGQQSYVLTKGDTLFGLSRRFQVPVAVLQTFNRIQDPAGLRAGATILIPSVYTVRKGDTLYSIARDHGVKLAELTRLNAIAEAAALKVGRRLFLPASASAGAKAAAKSQPDTGQKPAPPSAPAGEQPASTPAAVLWPHPGKREALSGRITGALIYGQAGDRVLSVSTGLVVWVGPYRGFSRVVLIESENGYTYVYGGNEETLVAVGDRVRKGTQIGLLGRNAHQGIPQLYFLVYRDGVPVDPSQAPRS
jgi:murein DD-endopeptidase MepM/ murein hydrolase activator NlpD